MPAPAMSTRARSPEAPALIRARPCAAASRSLAAPQHQRRRHHRPDGDQGPHQVEEELADWHIASRTSLGLLPTLRQRHSLAIGAAAERGCGVSATPIGAAPIGRARARVAGSPGERARARGPCPSGRRPASRAGLPGDARDPRGRPAGAGVALARPDGPRTSRLLRARPRGQRRLPQRPRAPPRPPGHLGRRLPGRRGARPDPRRGAPRRGADRARPGRGASAVRPAGDADLGVPARARRPRSHPVAREDARGARDASPRRGHLPRAGWRSGSSSGTSRAAPRGAFPPTTGATSSRGSAGRG